MRGGGHRQKSPWSRASSLWLRNGGNLKERINFLQPLVKLPINDLAIIPIQVSLFELVGGHRQQWP